MKFKKLENKILVIAALGIVLSSVQALPPNRGSNHPTVAPEFSGHDWVNTPQSFTMKGERGRVVILNFWTFLCSNCRNNLPAYERIRKVFLNQKVDLLGIHTPETNSERNVQNVKREIKLLGVHFPTLIDNQGTNWSAWNQQFWPAVYVIDKRGNVRGYWEGELNFDGANGEQQVINLVKNLLKE